MGISCGTSTEIIFVVLKEDLQRMALFSNVLSRRLCTPTRCFFWLFWVETIKQCSNSCIYSHSHFTLRLRFENIDCKGRNPSVSWDLKWTSKGLWQKCANTLGETPEPLQEKPKKAQTNKQKIWIDFTSVMDQKRGGKAKTQTSNALSERYSFFFTIRNL